MVMTGSVEQEKFYKSVLRILETEVSSRCLDDKGDRQEVAHALAHALGKGKISFYQRIEKVLEDSCTSFCLDDELDRVRTARAIAKEW